MENNINTGRNYFLLLSTIILLSSCACSELKNENKDLKGKLEKIEEEIREQIAVEIEKNKSEVELLKKDIELLNEKLLKINPEKYLSQLYNDVKPSVYLIYTEKNEGISQGSAFVISSNGLAISNQHIFDNASAAIVTAP